MPIQLKVIAIVLAFLFFFYTVKLVREDRAEIRQMRKWLVFAVIILIGSLVPDLGTKIAHFLGIRDLTSLALFSVSGIVVIFLLRMQLSLITMEKKVKVLIQTVSLQKKELEEKNYKEDAK